MIFVDDSAPPGGNGRNWNHAFRHLQDALFAAEGDRDIREIRVAQGVYLPDRGMFAVPLDRDETFFLIDGVALRGGYRGKYPPAGGAGNPHDRDIDAFRSVLSGDLLQDHFDYADNSFHIVTAMHVGPETVLDGFEIREGSYDDLVDPPQFSSGALTVFGGSPLIQDCRIVDNRGHGSTGGCALFDSDARFRECLFLYNFSTWSAAAMFISGGSPQIDDCLFLTNFVYFGSGGAIVASESGVYFRRCLLLDNSAGDRGGAMTISADFGAQVVECDFVANFADRGGAVSGHCLFRRCRFADNTAWTRGGALSGGGTLVGCIFERNESYELGGGAVYSGGDFINCIFRQNSASEEFGGGGAIRFRVAPASMTNCVIDGNGSLGAGGAVFIENGPFITTVPITNCTIVSNSGAGTSPQAIVGPAILSNTIVWGNLGGSLSGPTSVSFSCIQGGWAGDQVIANDPLFVNALGPDGLAGTSDDDLRLNRLSPCINTGGNELLPSDISDVDRDGDVDEILPLDLAGQRRVMSPYPNGARIVDMGALEFVLFHSMHPANLTR